MLQPGSARIAVLGAFLSAAAVAQEGVDWFVRVSDAGLRLAGPVERVVERAMSGPITTPPGDYAVHFARDARGKPDSLMLNAPDGATVAVTVEHAAAAEPAPREVLARMSDYVVAASVEAADSGGRLGLFARRADDDNWYRFVWDRARGQFRLERAIAGAMTVIRVADAPRGDDRRHELALQVEGFRLHAYFDDALVLQALDGAHSHGGVATHSAEVMGARWSTIVVEPAAQPRPSSALVNVDGAATLTAATAAAGGHHHVLELRLDRPHPLVPRVVSGLELWLLQRPAAPVIVRGDFSGDLGEDSIGEVPPDGRIRSELRWPDGAALGGQAALVRALVVSPDGDRLVSRTPSVPVLMSQQE